jgi:hypothetical protein
MIASLWPCESNCFIRASLCLSAPNTYMEYHRCMDEPAGVSNSCIKALLESVTFHNCPPVPSSQVWLIYFRYGTQSRLVVLQRLSFIDQRNSNWPVCNDRVIQARCVRLSRAGIQKWSQFHRPFANRKQWHRAARRHLQLVILTILIILVILVIRADDRAFLWPASRNRNESYESCQ